MKKPLKQFLQEILPYVKYVQLHINLGVSAKKLTRLLNGTDLWSLENVKQLLELIKYSNSPADLIKNTDMQVSITVNELEALNPWWEEKLQKLQN